MSENEWKKYIAVDTSTGSDLSAVCVAMVNAAGKITALLCREFSEAFKEIWIERGCKA